MIRRFITYTSKVFGIRRSQMRPGISTICDRPEDHMRISYYRKWRRRLISYQRHHYTIQLWVDDRNDGSNEVFPLKIYRNKRRKYGS